MNARRPDILVIGYGNEIRSDDGAGRLLAEIVEAWDLPNVRTISARQLVPEMAEELSQARLAIFADAYEAERQRDPVDSDDEDEAEPPDDFLTRLVRIRPAASDSPLGHSPEPGMLLVYAGAIYGHMPHAWMIALPGACFELGDTISQGTDDAIFEAALGIRKLAERRMRQEAARA